VAGAAAVRAHRRRREERWKAERWNKDELSAGFNYITDAAVRGLVCSARTSTPEIVMAGTTSDVDVAMQDGVLVTSSQVPAASKRTVSVDGLVERPAEVASPAGEGRALQTWISRDVGGQLAALTMASDSSSTVADDPSPRSDDSGLTTRRHFVVVAVDFGTALSGYAFAFVRDPCRAIHMMRRWDGGDPGVINQKTPTTLLLDPVGRFHSFGYTARDFYHDLDEDEARQWLFFDKFKMTLHHNDVNAACSVYLKIFIYHIIMRI